MYRSAVIVDHSMDAPCVTSMYKLRSIHEDADIPVQCVNSEEEKGLLEILQQQETILAELKDLHQQLTAIQAKAQKAEVAISQKPAKSKITVADSDLVINANLAKPPYFLLSFKKLWEKCDLPLQMTVQTFKHSSVETVGKKAEALAAALATASNSRSTATCNVSLIWKNVQDTELKLYPQLSIPIVGEANIARYLGRISGLANGLNLEAEYLLDMCHLLSSTTAKSKKQSLVNVLSESLGKSRFFCNANKLGVVDIAASSALKNVGNAAALPANLTKWLESCD